MVQLRATHRTAYVNDKHNVFGKNLETTRSKIMDEISFVCENEASVQFMFDIIVDKKFSGEASIRVLGFWLSIKGRFVCGATDIFPGRYNSCVLEITLEKTWFSIQMILMGVFKGSTLDSSVINNSRISVIDSGPSGQTLQSIIIMAYTIHWCGKIVSAHTNCISISMTLSSQIIECLIYKSFNNSNHWADQLPTESQTLLSRVTL